MTNEFSHYPGCKGRDPDNCSACALTDTRQDAPNYSGWPLAYMENNRAIPAQWRDAFKSELARKDNIPYVMNVEATMAKRGVRFTDAPSLFITALAAL